MQHKLPKGKITHGVGLFDLHFPYEDKAAFEAVMEYIVASQPDVCILGGDVVDLDIISDKSKSRQVEGKRLAKDFNYAANRLQQLSDASDWEGKYFLQGNHDERMERYIDDHPETEGILEVQEMLKLQDNGWVWVPSWRHGVMLTIGKANFIHGLTEGKHHAAKTVDDYGANMFYSHVHDVQSHSKILHGNDSTIMAQSCGCLCRYDMPYLKGRPTKWQHAFLNIYWTPDGRFYHTVVPIFNGQFVVDGTKYGRNSRS